MANNSSIESLGDFRLHEVCLERTSWNFLVTFACFSSAGVIFQIIFIVIIGREQPRQLSLQQLLFFAFQFVFLTSYSLSFCLQHSGQCGWISLGNISCRINTWIKHLSYTTCNCLLLFPWDRQYTGFVRYKILSFRLYIVCAFVIFGIFTLPYAIFSSERTTQILQKENAVISLSYCVLSTAHDKSIEIIEVICGTAILGILVFVRVILNILKMLPKQTNGEVKENRRYSQPPLPEVISSAKDKLNSRRILQLNIAISISYLVFVVPQRHLDFVLFLYGNAGTVHTTGTENISLLSDDNWRILLSYFSISPVLHSMVLLPAYVLTEMYARNVFRIRASQPIKRRMPIRQHNDTNFCKSIEEASETGSENDNSEVDNGSIVKPD